jgi:hypothetical protein
LEAEFAVENLLFYEAFEYLRELTQEICSIALEIKAKFISSSSISSVNLSNEKRTAGMNSLEDIDSLSPQVILAVLKPCQDEVLRLMAGDSFLRLKSSVAYKDHVGQKNTGLSSGSHFHSLVEMLQ